MINYSYICRIRFLILTRPSANHPNHPLNSAPLSSPVHLRSRSKGDSSGSLSSSRSVKLDVVGELGLLSREVRGRSSLRGGNLDAENLSSELEDLVLYFAILCLLAVQW